MNNLDSLYKELGNKICLFPFFGVFYSTVNSGTDNNTVRPCSLFKKISPVVNNNILESINTNDWQDLRKKFVSGQFEQITECSTCHTNERNGTTSARLGNNQYFSEHLSVDIIQTIKEIINNNYQVDKITSLDYFPSNYCNYSCVMCYGNASSSRRTYELKIANRFNQITINTPDLDFFDILKNVQIINFTGGETVMQPQVTNIINYLVQENLASNITIFLLTNASSYPDHLIDHFTKFKKVVYMCSIDGVAEVIEYQRRGAVWSEVESNIIQLNHNKTISTVNNYVLTAINCLSFMDVVDWLSKNQIRHLAISTVTQKFLSLSVLPPKLKNLALSRLTQGQQNYPQGTYGRELIDQVIGVLEHTTYEPVLLPVFIKHILLEDSASKKSLAEVVPEWEEYFYEYAMLQKKLSVIKESP
jgi:organic radical activating enzyme